MPPPSQIECPWCEDDQADGETFRVHLMVEHRKSELASYVEERVADEERREVLAR